MRTYIATHQDTTNPDKVVSRPEPGAFLRNFKHFSADVTNKIVNAYCNAWDQYDISEPPGYNKRIYNLANVLPRDPMYQFSIEFESGSIIDCTSTDSRLIETLIHKHVCYEIETAITWHRPDTIRDFPMKKENVLNPEAGFKFHKELKHSFIPMAISGIDLNPIKDYPTSFSRILFEILVEEIWSKDVYMNVMHEHKLVQLAKIMDDDTVLELVIQLRENETIRPVLTQVK
tara:strand:- start:234083 stop:234775 length:693 start_codon:yes stop_codon:yes gene_type:complete